MVGCERIRRDVGVHGAEAMFASRHVCRMWRIKSRRHDERFRREQVPARQRVSRCQRSVSTWHMGRLHHHAKSLELWCKLKPIIITADTLYYPVFPRMTGLRPLSAASRIFMHGGNDGGAPSILNIKVVLT